MTEQQNPAEPENGGKEKGEKTFTEAQVAAIVQQRLDQQAKTKFGDYDDLKTQVEGAKSNEQKLADKLAELEQKHAESEARALRASIAAQYGISTKKGDKGEPSDADLFLTGSDEATLTAQAERLGVKVADQKKQGNVAPKEGQTKTTGDGAEGMREFTRNLFGNSD